MQLDIFEHSRDVMLRNDATLALERRNAVAVLSAIQVLGEEYPDDKLIPDLNVLSAAIEGGTARGRSPVTWRCATRV